MAMLASKSSFPTPSLGQSSSHSMSSNHYSTAPAQRVQTVLATNAGVFTSPTESEFSEDYAGPDSVRSWDEKRVSEWLRQIHAEKYEQLFRANHFNGDNLLECDQNILKDMGIKKIGDRVRIFVAVKQLRKKTLKSRNRDSFAALDKASYTPSSSDSPRTYNASRNRTDPTPVNRRYSRQMEQNLYSYASTSSTVPRPSSRPSSPLADSSERGLRAHQRGYAASPLEGSRRDPGQAYFTQPTSAGSSSSRQVGGNNIVEQTARVASHLRQNPSLDGLTMGTLPASQPVIRIIYTGGQTKVLNVKNCRTSDEIITCVLKKLALPENQYRNYCFYVLDGLEPNPALTRRLSESELMRICTGGKDRSERNRLILRKIHAGEPDQDELRRATQIAYEESQISHTNAINANSARSQAKLQKLTGEAWDNVKYPMSPAPFVQPTERTRSQTTSTIDDRDRAAGDLEGRDPQDTDYDQTDSSHARSGSMSKTKLRQFFGGRPPSEMIIHELTTYFPTHQKEEIEKTMRLSVRRSQRISRAASHLSVVSNASYASSLKDAPPLPSIADAWLAGAGGAHPTRASRPLSVSKFGALPSTAFRDSIASSALQPLAEESPVEPDRKSYVSFDSGSDSANIDNGHQSFFDETHSLSQPETETSLNSHLSQIVNADGDEADDELTSFLNGNSWDNVSWMRGALIGQGSFGSVYLALHSITGELMAVKQVELPNVQKGTEIDKKKTSMITALKHEIDLLRDLQHPNIVTYLGTAADEQHLNIFLEYVPGGSIAAMLKQYNTFQEPLIRNFVRQILDGLSYLHGRDIIHRDIKGANVLVDNKGGIKISDFGISKRVEASSMLSNQPHINRPSLQGSVFWMAPEVVRQTAHTKKADIWSLGCLVVEMFSGQHPFPNSSQLQAIFALGSNQAKPTIPEECSEEARKFLDRTFEIDHEKRPSADELAKSAFLALKPIA